MLGGEPVQFRNREGAVLGGTRFVEDAEPHTALLINSGTGIPQRFYAAFAEHAAARRFAVLTWDYRGIGESAPDSLKDCKVRYRDWGHQDVPAAIHWLATRYPDLPLTVLGHSTGGQQLGLAHNVGEVKAAAFVAVSTGYWGGMPWRYKLFSLALWKLYMPLATRFYGYAPSRKIRWGENLPAGVAREWGAWCMQPEYLAAFFDETGYKKPPDGDEFGPTWFEQMSCPIQALYFTDDPISTRANAPPMLALFENARIDTRWIAPSEIGVDAIGHIGFFRPGVGEPLWDGVLERLKLDARGRGGGCR